MVIEFFNQYPEIKEFYKKVGFGARCGFGERPAIVVIDLAKAWTDPKSRMGADLSGAITNTVKILRVARETRPKISIVFTVMSFDPTFKDVSETFLKKVPVSKEYLVEGSKWLELDRALERQPDELLMVKKHSSCFWGTTFLEQLVSAKVDTLIITGCSISACVLHTAIDSIQYGFHTIVPAEAVGDRDPIMGSWALAWMDLRRADVVSVEGVLEYLAKFKG